MTTNPIGTHVLVGGGLVAGALAGAERIPEIAGPDWLRDRLQDSA